jgi:DNA topoisomerase-1
MEKELDEIGEGEKRWVDVLKKFYGAFAIDLDKATETMESVKGQEPPIPVACEKCGKPMFVKWNKYGKFLGCSAYPECKSAKSMASPEAAGEDCDLCKSPMVIKAGRFGRFLACSKYPECKSTRPIPRGNRKLVVPKDWTATCEKCQSRMAVKYGRRGAFIACLGYPNCKNTQKVPKEWYVGGEPEKTGPKERLETPPGWSETCEKCASPMHVRKGAKGWFISCTGYPRCRNVKQVPLDWIKVDGQSVAAPPPEAVQPDADED